MYLLPAIDILGGKAEKSSDAGARVLANFVAIAQGD